MSAVLTSRALGRYALLGLPLGAVGLPLYVHLPKYYADSLPLSLAVIGMVMFLARIVDCLADPLIGYLTDRFASRRRMLSLVAMVVLAGGVLGLFFLPDLALGNLTFLLSALLIITYLAYSFLTIGFYASGLALTRRYEDTLRVSAWREASIMVGVLLATALPIGLMQSMPMRTAYHWFAFAVVGVIAVAALVALPANSVTHSAPQSPLAALRQNVPLRWIFAVFFLNAIAPSITATLFLFFTQDVLHLASWSSAFLLVYFLSAILTMPLWARLAARIGKRRALIFSMLLALCSFLFAYRLEEGQLAAFFMICVGSGIALGGDLSILPSLLADAIGDSDSRGGVEFGIWNFISKLTLALAAGIALPALSYAGYVPDAPSQNTHALSVAYALLPCGFKLAALCLLVVSPIDHQRRRT